MTDSFALDVTESEPGIRLDTWLHRQLPHLSRSAFTRLITDHQVKVNDQVAKPRYTPKVGDHITVTIPQPSVCTVDPEPIPIEILHEDKHLLVLNKASGICVHPSAGHPNGTLVNALLHHCHGQLSGIGGVSRPGIVHRLDQDTSGCIVVAKDNETHTGLTTQFAERLTHKTYLAITCGNIRPREGDIIANIARHPSHRKRMAVSDGTGRDAHTSYQLKEDYAAASLVEAVLHTGRTHQIRVHFKHIGFPIFGDTVYGNRQSKQLATAIGFTPARQLLHAQTLTFQHPISKQTITTSAPLPPDMKSAMEHLEKSREVKT